MRKPANSSSCPSDGGAGAGLVQIDLSGGGLAARRRRVAVCGNPNTGKTSLFNRLTGSRAKVGNFPGVTVESHRGDLTLPDGMRVELFDVPGTYSLVARALEERIALQAIVGLAPHSPPDAALIVVDATQLERNLYFVLQVLELGTPAVVAITMNDRLAEQGTRIDREALERALGVPVVEVHTKSGRGLETLARQLEVVLKDPASACPGSPWELGPLEPVVDAVAKQVPEAWHGGDPGRRRALASWALLSADGDDEFDDIPPALREAVAEAWANFGEGPVGLDESLIRARYAWIEEHSPSFLTVEPTGKTSLAERLDRLLLHPALGFGFFLGLMALVFQALFAWADPLIGMIEGWVGVLGAWVEGSMGESLLREFLVNGVIAGVGGVLVFLPQILLLFLFIGIMEDSGYMARVVYLMDRIMSAVGLHGRAFVPMLSGLACAVPAVLATRTMERRRDRFLTMMVVPLMTCSARLPVYGLLIAAMLPVGEGGRFTQGLMLAGMYLFSTVVALLAAGVLGRTVFKGVREPLLMEMPPYRLPDLRSLLVGLWEKASLFVREAGTVILVCTIALWFLLSFPRHGDLGQDFEAQRSALRQEATQEAGELELGLAAIDHEEAGARLRQSYGGRLGRAIEPTIAPLGFDWKVGIGLVGAFAAREVFVSTMAVVYGLDAEESEESRALRARMQVQRWPDGRKVYTPLMCFSLMVFFALACQCMSTLAAVKRETGGYRWPLFMFVYMTALAWGASFAVYQGGQLFGLH